MAVKVIGLDIAKHVFQLHGADAKGKAVLKKRLRREQVTDFFGSIPRCTVAMEATQGAHYWARVLTTFGHEVRLISPQFVKPYVRGQKNDMQDAAAICEAASRPEMRFVPQKSIAQQDMQMLHRIRSRLIANRTQVGNQIRGLLAEYGIVVPLHLSQLRKHVHALASEPHAQLTAFAQLLFAGLYEELCQLDDRIQAMEERIDDAFRADEACQRISRVEGIGPVIATAIVAAIANGRAFRNGRQLSAWLGLVPRQYSSGDKQRLLGISKRGDPYLRTLLIHGARSVVYRSIHKSDARSRWIADKQKRLGTTKACVAVANKNARIIWAILAKDEHYRKAA
ncbi:MAG TPA: IS110 family transposase [Bryobacteraceae bacterium]|jgi:transposase|nr:IS110 family transposase [Bryobacteraceae bacterium]